MKYSFRALSHEHGSENLSLRPWFQSLWIHTQGWGGRIIWWFYLTFFEDLSCCSPERLHCSTGVPLSPHPHQYLLSVVCFIKAILTRTRWHLVVVLICISLKIRKVEYLLMGLLAISVPMEKCLFKSFAHSLLNQVVSVCVCGGRWLFCWVVGIPYIFWILTPFQTQDLQIFSLIPSIAFPLCWLHPLCFWCF